MLPRIRILPIHKLTIWTSWNHIGKCDAAILANLISRQVGADTILVCIGVVCNSEKPVVFP